MITSFAYLRLPQKTWLKFTWTLRCCIELTNLLSLDTIDKAFNDPQFEEDFWNNAISALDSCIKGLEFIYILLKSYCDCDRISITRYPDSEKEVIDTLALLHQCIGKLHIGRSYAAKKGNPPYGFGIPDSQRLNNSLTFIQLSISKLDTLLSKVATTPVSTCERVRHELDPLAKREN